jgi:hypothetical protein
VSHSLVPAFGASNNVATIEQEAATVLARRDQLLLEHHLAKVIRGDAKVCGRFDAIHYVAC